MEKLIRVGPEKSWAYAPEAFGIAKSAEAKVRSATADACGRPGAQSCPITTIAATLGTQADPLSIGVCKSVTWWVHTWHQSTIKPILRRAWAKLHGQLCAKMQWETVTGPIGTLIMYLHLIGWQHVWPDQWTDELGVK